MELPDSTGALPLVGALAAGDRALLKPSELTPRTSALLAELIGKYFEPGLVSVVLGDGEIGKAFVALPFDHLLFTGSTAVGRQVAAAAAVNLTPITLELGGKSPAILDASCDLAKASARIAAGKLLNAGQTCVAPDYLLVPRGQRRSGRVGDRRGDEAPLSDAGRQSRLHRDHQRSPSRAARRPRRRSA